MIAECIYVLTTQIEMSAEPEYMQLLARMHVFLKINNHAGMRNFHGILQIYVFQIKMNYHIDSLHTLLSVERFKCRKFVEK